MKDIEKIYFLLGDIGGTNARLKLVNVKIKKSPEIEEIFKLTYTITSDKLISTLKEFISNCINKYSIKPNRAILGVPGAIISNTIFLSTNLPCLNNVSGEQLSKELQIESVTFLNDFNINGYAIQSENLKKDIDYFQINPSIKNQKDSSIAMIGPGTGLGMGYLTKSLGSVYYNVHSAEGGSAEFAAEDDIEFSFCKFLKDNFKSNYITNEDLCCGKTINLLFYFLSKNTTNTMNDIDNKILSNIKILWNKNSPQTEFIDINKDIINEGTKEGNTESTCLCTKVVNMFIKIYAKICSQFSLAYLPYNGLYLLGGISAALAKYMIKDNIFMNYYLKRDDIKVILKNIPIFIVTNTNFGVYGAEEYAKKIVLDNLSYKI